MTSLASTALQTYQSNVLRPSDQVEFFGGNRVEPAAFRYPNKSLLVVGGMDKPHKIMSSEYDIFYAPECTELIEDEWEKASSRLRWGRLPYQQMLGDCNPDTPTHWLKRREMAGLTMILESRHEDNPSVTQDYLDRLDRLTGVRYQRLRLGRWVAAEGLVYEGWDRATHLVDPFQIPADWSRYWVVDFGFTNPFVCQWWAEDPDGRLYRYRELYRTQTLVEDHARAIKAISAGEPRPKAVICDHDAEGRATLEKYLDVRTVKARKTVTDGIQAVAARLRVQPDGKPRLYLVRDALVDRDADLEDAKRPCSTEEEIDGYVWDTSHGQKRGEQPVKQDDHGMDTMRYMVAHRDLQRRWGAH